MRMHADWCHWTRGDLLALAMPLVALGLTYATWPILQPNAWFFFLAAAYASAWLGSARASTLATLASAWLGFYCFLEPRYTWVLDHPTDLWMVAFVLLLGGLFTYLRSRLRASAAATARAERDAGRAAERERIASDLHDTVIQRLFAAGLSLDAAATETSVERMRSRMARVVEDLGQVTEAIRAIIFDLRRRNQDDGVRAEVTHLVRAAAARGGLTPHLTFTGPVDSVVDDGLRENLLAVVEELISGIDRQGNASEFRVSLAVTASDIVVAVADDGEAGLDGHAGRDGDADVCQRAERFGGRCTVSAATPRGTVVTWSTAHRG